MLRDISRCPSDTISELKLLYRPFGACKETLHSQGVVRTITNEQVRISSALKSGYVRRIDVSEAHQIHICCNTVVSDNVLPIAATENEGIGSAVAG